jgi:serine phosphatase RsbU (regulator of sigma subunit)
MLRSIKYCCFLLLLINFLVAQELNVDFLKNELKLVKNDSIKAVILNALTANSDEGDWEKYNDELKLLAEKNLKNCHTTSLCKFYKTQTAAVLSNIGYINMDKGLSDVAIEYYLKALKIYEELNVVEEIASVNSNIGFVYQQQNEDDQAFKFYFKSWQLYKSINSKTGLAASYNNMAYIYKTQKKYKEAKSNYIKAIELYEQIGDKNGVATSLNNLGLVYKKMRDTTNAIICYKKSVVLFEQGNDKEGLLYCYNNIGNLLKSQNKFDEAFIYAAKSFELSKKCTNPEAIYTSANLNYFLFKKKKNYKEALDMYELSIRMKDSVSNENNHVSILEQQHKYNEEKELLKHEKQMNIQIAEREKTKLITIAIIGILGLVCIFSVWMFFKFKQTQRQKNIIAIQNDLVQKQKQLVEEKQKEISDSINYAHRIQSSFMASENDFAKVLKDYFIFFKPKDVVSGDFYWAHSFDSNLFLCVADSTGHGIPGAFMSLLNISLLNEAIFSKELTNTDEILNFVRKILIKGLKQDISGQGGNDGMDCCITKIDFTKLELQYSGANNPLWIVRQNSLIEIKADKMAVGRSPKQENSFTHQSIKLEQGDSLYLFTDGFPDQFGGPKGKKFMYKQLEELLVSVADKPMSEQKEELNQSFENWKGDLEQVDDVCIIGIKIYGILL